MRGGHCLACGLIRRVQPHHVTGRSRGSYLHPDLVAPLCEPCHRGVHVLLRAAGLERAGVAKPELRRPVLVFGRVSVFLGFLAVRSLPVELPTQLVAGLAGALEEAVRELRPREPV